MVIANSCFSCTLFTFFETKLDGTIQLKFMGLTELSKRLNNSKAYNIGLLIIGLVIIVTGYEEVWRLLMGVFLIAIAAHSLYKITTAKPI